MNKTERIKKIRDCVPQKMFFEDIFEKTYYAASILSEVSLSYEKVEYNNILNCAPLLTKKQEFHLFRQFNYLRYRLIKMVVGFDSKSETAKPCKPLKMERLGDNKLKEIEDLINKMNEVRNLLLKSNMRLIVKQVSRHIPKDSFERDEFLSNAYFHVLKSIDCFDYTRGLKFSTYCINVLRTNLWKDMIDLNKRQKILNPEPLEYEHAPEQDLSEHNEEYNKKMVDLVFEEIKKSMKKPQERITILKSYFGINQEKPTKVVDIAKKLGYSRECIKNMRNKTIEALKRLNYDPLV